MENIKSLYILRLIFNDMPKLKSLKIVKYNKNLLNKLNIGFNGVKELSKIEIEIIPTTKEFGEY